MESISEKPEEKLKCPICKAPAESRCAGCNRVAYCSRDHQKQHWKKHKSECQVWKLVESPELGRFLVATRDVRPGELIFQEKPLLLAPPKVTRPLCLHCYTEFPDPPDPKVPEPENSVPWVKPRKCPRKCGWPICAQQCSGDSKDHDSAECKYGDKRGGVAIRHYGVDHPTYQAVSILRFLALKETNPRAYETLLTLQSHHKTAETLAQDDEQMKQDFKSRNDMLVKLIRDFFELRSVTEEEILQMNGIIETNGHEIPLPPTTENGCLRRLTGVYHIASFLGHNCTPNCVKTWDIATHEIQIRSCLPVKKGDPLSICYVDPMWGTADRVHFLQISKFFTCKCTRCSDPTELGTYTSSVRCQQIQCSNLSKIVQPNLGLICVEDPFDPESDWKCNNCGEFYSATFMGSMMGKVGTEMEALEDKHGDIEALEEFLRKFAHLLAPNHFYLLEIKLELAQLYGRCATEPLPFLPPEKLLRKKQLCDELLKVVNVICPGLTRLRALLLYELQATTAALSRLMQVRGEISPQVHRAELEQCVKWMKEVVLVLSWEPENSVENRRATGAKRELEELQAMLTADELD